MADLPSTARVVIIGGGAVGTSCLFHLARLGWTDCLLLEKNELTAGSTWHAAGNVPTFSSSWSVMSMQRYSTELYRGLAEAVDYPMNYHVTGSIRLAHTAERLMEFKRVAGMGRYQGMEIDLLSPNEVKGRYPFMETHDLTGVLYDPFDGDIDPAQLTQAFAKGARDLGATIQRFCPVTGVRRVNGEWIVETPQGSVRAEYVVNAAGYYAGEVGRMFGRDVPMMVMSHQYILFDDIPEIAEWSQNEARNLPLLRDVDTSYYLRQEKFGMNLGPYERNCRAHWIAPDDPMPEDFSFQLFPDDLDRLESYLMDAAKRVPLLQTAGLSKVINGPIPYTPDGNPLIGPMPGVPNAFEACVFTFGICQAGGAGKVLAEWVTDGATEWDMWSCDPRRFTEHADRDYCVAKGMEVYGHEYAIHFPRHEWPAARDKKVSPVHERIVAMGGQMGAYGGWERANWFAKPGDDTSEEATQTWSRHGPWEPRIREECEAVRDAAGILDLPGFSRFALKGDEAAGWLAEQITGKVPRTGRIGLGYFADERGRIVTEMSVIRMAEDEILLITAAPAQWHDFAWLQARLPAGGSLALDDRTRNYSCHILTGPKSRAVLSGLCDADLAKPWLTWQQTEIAGREVFLFRVSYAGELGWEIHTRVGDTEAVFEAVLAAGEPHGLAPFGMYALDSLRLEKGYRTWKGDLSTDYTVLEGGLDRFVVFDKPESFAGKAALAAERQRGSARRFVTLTVEAGDYDAPYMSTLWHGDTVVGETTSGGWGYRTDGSIALGVLRADLAEPGTEIEVEIFGEHRRATVQPDAPLWDPDNERLRG